MGDLVQNILCAELMGRCSNLVLVQNGNALIFPQQVDFEDGDVRRLLPGLPILSAQTPAAPTLLVRIYRGGL